MSSAVSLGNVIGAGVDRVIADAVRLVSPGAFVVRPVFRGATTTVRVPKPLVALAPAILVEMHARNVARGLACGAREDGASWQEIALAAGIRPDLPDSDRGFHAWAWAAGEHLHGYDRSVGWHCGNCHRHVTDYGPDGGHPVDAECGHDRDCARQQAAIREWECFQDDWDGAA